MAVCRALSKASEPEDKAATKDALELKAKLFKKLGWHHWHRHELSRIKLLFPKAYPLF